MRPFVVLRAFTCAFLATLAAAAQAGSDGTVEVGSDRPGLVLQLRWPEGEWRDVCTLPCRIRPVPAPYRVEAGHIATSDDFSISPVATRVDVQSAPLSNKVLGAVLTPVGGVMIVAPLGFLAMSALCEDSPDRCGPNATARTVAFGVMAAGAATLVTGLWFLANRHTKVRVDEPWAKVGPEGVRF